MRARISDKQVLQSISPAQIRAYLRSKGAVQVDEYTGKATIWKYGSEELLVPLAVHFADYASRVADILASLEREEDRSQLLIEADLRHSGFDVIRVRNVSEDTRQGSLNLTRSVDFVSKTKDMLLAAACSASTHKISYPRKKPQNAEAFLETVRFGQTAQGSFILQLLSPVTPDLYTQNSIIEIPEDLPYEKTVIPTLQSGLETLNVVAQRTSEDNSLEHFQNAAAYGVTTNLCDAVSGMYDSLRPQYIEISISYSPNRRQQHPLAKVSVDSGYIPLIKELSSTIKATEPESEVEQLVRGSIVKLESEHPVEAGEITIKDLMTPHPRFLVVELAGEDYRKAVMAHNDNQLIELAGTVIKSGRTCRLVAETPLTFIDTQG